MGNVEYFFGDGSGFAEKVVRLVGMERLPRPGRVDDGVDRDVGHVHALWPQFARQRLGENALRRFGRCEHGGTG